MSAPKAWISWSSGKDGAWALHEVRRAGRFEVTAALTTVTSEFGRVSMHGVREVLLDRQLAAAGLDARRVSLPWPCPNAEYERAMAGALERARAEGVTHVIFGDLFLEDIRRYREERLAGTGLTPVFPLWGRPTRGLADEMIAGGLRATLTCIDPRRLDRRHAGRSFDATLMGDLPDGVDPCGENGEFHTFVSDGPMFRRPVAIAAGEVVERDGFIFADLLDPLDALPAGT